MDTLNDIISGLKWGNLDTVEAHDRVLLLFNVSDLLIAWEQYKKANWWKSDAVDVEKVLMKQFVAIYRR
jgi:hypothetical protein